MAERITKAELLARIASKRADWDRLIGQIPPFQLELPGVAGDWSIKDVITHVGWYEERLAGVLVTRGLTASDLWNLSLEERNSAIRREYQNLSIDDVLQNERRAYQDLYRAIESLTEKDLHDPRNFAGMPADWVPWDVIAGNTCDHYDEHIPDIVRWLQGSEL